MRKCHAQLHLRGGMKLSVVASSQNYCSPRADNLLPYDYETFEIALLSNDSAWLNPSMETDMKKKPWSKFWDEYDNVAGWVPADVVQQIYDELKEAV